MRNIRRVFIEAISGFVLWTSILTPYILIFVTKDMSGYFSWLFMQAIIVPPISVVVLRITNWITRKLK